MIHDAILQLYNKEATTDDCSPTPKTQMTGQRTRIEKG